MPELPEVETTRRGVEPFLKNKIIKKIEVRNSSLSIHWMTKIDASPCGSPTSNRWI